MSEGEPISGFASLDVWSTSYTLAVHGNAPNRNSGVPIRDIVIGDGARRLSADGLIWIPEDSPDTPSPTIMIPAFPHSSPFGREVSSFLFSPFSESEDILVLSPSDATEYAYQGQITYTTLPVRGSTAPRNHWFRATVRVDSETQEPLRNGDFVPCGIQPHSNLNDNDIQIPRQAFSVFLEQVRVLGVRDSYRSYKGRVATYLVDLDPERLATLPAIEFIIRAVDGTHVQIASLKATEYLVPSNEEPHVYRVLLYTSGINEGSFVLTPRVTKNLLIHFDYENNRIGFADPLVEIV